MKNLVSKSESLDKSSNVLVDYKSVDYRGFVFVVHHAHGMMLLRCTRKKNKPHHWQLPGGHIDKTEFVEAARANFVHNTQLLEAGKRGAARELFEETGIDVRSQLHRMEPATLREPKDGESELANEYKHRLFYILNVANDDFLSHGETPMGTLGETLKVSTVYLAMIYFACLSVLNLFV
jgi:8-oxo-dGTP pyrophosphatase MutT (NUDIX family)